MHLCLLGNENWSRIKRMEMEAIRRGHRIYRHNPDRLLFSLKKGVLEVQNHIPWEKLDAVVILKRLPENDIYGWTEFLKRHTKAKIFFNKFGERPLSHYSYLSRAYHIEEKGIRTPDTRFFGPDASLTEAVKGLQYPVTIKRAHSSIKDGIGLAENARQARRLIQKLREGDSLMMVRTYIPHELEWRVVVLGGKPIAAYERRSRSQKFLAAFGKKGRRRGRAEHEIPEVAKLAVKSARALKYELCGVDIIEDRDSKQLFVLDVNPNPRYEMTEKKSKVNIAEELIKYIEEKIKR